MSPKVKAVGAMALYGTVGGALLGTASLAFGTKARSIAKGASLGLYAGLLFGAYVVAGHSLKNFNYDDYPQDDEYYPDTSTSPYEGGGEASGSPGTNIEAEQEAYRYKSVWERDTGIGSRPNEQVYYMEFLRIQF